MHDSFTPLGGFVPLWLMHLGEIIFGVAWNFPLHEEKTALLLAGKIEHYNLV